MMTHKCVLLVGNGPYSNRGCEAIVRGTVEILSRSFPRTQFVLSSFGDADCLADARNESDKRIVHKPHNDSWFKRFDADWWRYRVIHRASPVWQNALGFRVEFQATRNALCALQIGGDNYTLDYGKPLHHMALDKVMLDSGIPVVLWGASVGPFSTDSSFEETIARHLGRFGLILARESVTFDYLCKLGLGDRVKLMADPAFLLLPSCPELSSQLLEFIDRQPIGVNISPLLGKCVGLSYDAWLSTAQECIKSLISADMGPILLIPHVMQSGNDDYAFMEAVLQGLGEPTDQIMLAPQGLCASEYKWLISRMRAFVGARTHATIAAFSTCVPTLSISYSTKSIGINKDLFGSTDWVVPVSELTPRGLSSLMSDLLQAENDVKGRLITVVPEMKRRALMAGEYLAALVNAE
ncbi:MAG: polysaccharide pyruvyl transferase family protein [Armatimonadota bacterium]